jgi:hypothetical protein
VSIPGRVTRTTAPVLRIIGSRCVRAIWPFAIAKGVSVANVVQYGTRSEGDSHHPDRRALFDAAGK